MSSIQLPILAITAILILVAVLILWRKGLLRQHKKKKKIAAVILTGILLGSGAVIIMNEPPASSVVNNAGTGVNAPYASGTIWWGSCSKATAADDVFAVCNHTASTTSMYLRTYNYNFAATIAATDTITGIRVAINRKANANFAIIDAVVKLCNGANTTVGNNYADLVTTWTTTETAIKYGGSNCTDLWGAGLTTADIRDSDFGVYLATSCGSTGRIASVDNISITVYYTTIWSNTIPTFSNPSPASSATGRIPLCATNITVSDANTNQTITVNFWNNKTGTWVNCHTANTSTGSASYVFKDISAAYATNYNAKYWWKVTANDGLANTSVIYNFSTLVDTTPPFVRINYAGNLSDEGGPYYRPPDETDTLDEAGEGVFRNGYYTNDSYQKEGFIYINLSVVTETGSGMPTSNAINLRWYNATTGIWDNSTYFIPKNTAFYEINRTGNPAGKYSFNIYAVDKAGNVEHKYWNKTNLGGGYTRRYVNLNQTSTGITYTPLYFYSIPPVASGDLNKRDRLHKDQGTDGASYDTGFLRTTTPTDSLQNIYCAGAIGLWFDENSSIIPLTLTNIYYHVWYSVKSSESSIDVAWNKRRMSWGGVTAEEYNALNSLSRSNIYCNGAVGTGSYTKYFNLTTHLLSVTPTAMTDNDIFETYIETSAINNSVASNRSFTSFVIINVPSNATLNASYVDSDSDGMHDWDELYRNYTNPFLADTDYDGVNDYYEISHGTDPNNYTSTPEVINTAPAVSNPSPANNSFDNIKKPVLTVTVGDIDDATQNMNVTWSSNSSGSWQTFGLNQSVNNGTYRQEAVNFTIPGTRYYWRIILNDGAGGWDNHTYILTLDNDTVWRYSSGYPHCFFDLGDDTGVTNIGTRYSLITYSSSYIMFNTTGFMVTSTNRTNVTIKMINESITGAAPSDELLDFYAYTKGGTVWFNITGFDPSAVYSVKKNGNIIGNYTANVTGAIAFSNAAWSAPHFEIILKTSSASDVYSDTIRNNGMDYFIWLGKNTTAYYVRQNMTGLDEAAESISIWNRTSWSTSTGLWQTYNGTKTGVNWTVHTFQVIRTVMTDTADNQTILMFSNPDMDYTTSRSYTLMNLTKNKGYNYSAYNKEASTTLSAISSSIGLTTGEFCGRWNRTTFTWDLWISGFGLKNYQVSRWDVIITKVGATRTWTT